MPVLSLEVDDQSHFFPEPFLNRRGREFADDVTNRGKKLWDEHGDRITTAVKRGYEQAKNTATDAVNGATDATRSM